jgi:hypothetical protein
VLLYILVSYTTIAAGPSSKGKENKVASTMTEAEEEEVSQHFQRANKAKGRALGVIY